MKHKADKIIIFEEISILTLRIQNTKLALLVYVERCYSAQF